MRVMRVGIRTEPDEIDDLEDADRVNNEEYDEPPFLAIARRMPERIPFENNGPEQDDDEKGKERERQSGRERRIKWREVVHICG